jgi:3-oxoadipate enol-lactonase
VADFVETPRGSFYVEQTGPDNQTSPDNARSIVFVAGLGDDHASWDAPIEYLSPKYRCVTYDNRGIGRSPITDGPYTTRQLAEDAQAIADQLGLDKLIAVGSSMGGAISQEWALAQPGTIEHLVLSNTWGGDDAWFSALIEHWIQLAARGAGSDILYQLALFCFSPDYLSRHPETIEEFLASEMPDTTGFAAADGPAKATTPSTGSPPSTRRPSSSAAGTTSSPGQTSRWPSPPPCRRPNWPGCPPGT